jgi:hypothetical protein
MPQGRGNPGDLQDHLLLKVKYISMYICIFCLFFCVCVASIRNFGKLFSEQCGKER